MKTQQVKEEGFSGIQISLNLFEVEFVRQFAYTIKEWQSYKEKDKEWNNEYYSKNNEERDEWRKNNPRPERPEDPRDIFCNTLKFWEKIAEAIPSGIDMNNIFVE